MWQGIPRCWGEPSEEQIRPLQMGYVNCKVSMPEMWDFVESST